MKGLAPPSLCTRTMSMPTPLESQLAPTASSFVVSTPAASFTVRRSSPPFL